MPIRRSLVCLAAVLIALARLEGPHSAAAALPSTLGPEALHPGDRAVVRTVFRGDSIEEFPAEIVGVLAGGRAEGQVIVARAVSERLRQMGVAQGMSGSPVYVDGKLVGALSSSWPYEREPLFGITPIGDMLRLLDLPPGSTGGPSAGPSGADLSAGSSTVRFGEFRWEAEDARDPAEVPPGAAVPAGAASGPLPLPLPLSGAGLAPAAADLAQHWLAPLGFRVVAGGGAVDQGATGDRIEPGAAVAVDLVRGDVQLSAIGTVTWRDGDRLLLFGHPMFQSGGVRLPLSTASITTVVASDYLSFKLGARRREVGVVTQDRRSGVYGSIGGRAELLPVTVRVEGQRPAPQGFRFEVVEDRALVGPLAGVVTLNSLLESGGSGANQSFAWTLTLHRPGAAPLVMSDIAAGDSPAAAVAGAVNGPLAFLFGNPFTPLHLDSVVVSVRAAPGRAQWTLREARLLDGAVRPGGVARVACRIERWRGASELRTIHVPVPEELPEGRFVLWVGGGGELARLEAARLPARYQPTSLEDAWQRFGRLRRSATLCAVIQAEAPDVTVAGRDYPELPGSADVLLTTGLMASDQVRRSRTALLSETSVPAEGPVQGALQLTLIIDSKAP